MDVSGATLVTQEDSRRIRTNSAWMMSEQVIRQALSLVLTIWITRALGPEGFGRLSFALSLYALLAITTTLGLNRIMVREFAATSDASFERRLFSTALAMRLMAAAIVSVLAVVICLLIAPSDAKLVAILVLGYFFTAFDLVDLLFQSHLRSREVARSRLLAFLASSAVKAALLVSGAGIHLIAAACLLDWVAMAAGLIWLSHRRIGILSLPRPDWSIAALLFAESRIEIIAGFSGLAFMKIDQVMLQIMRGPAEVATMAVSSRLTEAWYFIPAALVASTFPVIVKLDAVAPERAIARLKSLYRSLVFLGVIAGLGAEIFASRFITLAYGKAFLPAAPVLAIQIWCGTFMSLGIASGAWLMAHRLGMLNLRRNVLGMLINVGLNLLLIPEHGAIGSAWATLAAFAFAYLAYDFLDPKMYAIGRHKLLAFVWR